MFSELRVYALELVTLQEFACLLDLEERRDRLLWVLEQEFPDCTHDDRFEAMLMALPFKDESDVIILEFEEIPH